MTPEAIREVVEAARLVPTDTDADGIERAREWERKIRAEQAERISFELAKRGLDYAAITTRHVSTEPTW